MGCCVLAGETVKDAQPADDPEIEKILSEMTLEEKTCQMVTLYGYRRVLEDQLPTPEWKERIWKDGMGAIDEHLNSFVGWNMPKTTESPYLWPPSKHDWALNEVQRFFVEETRLPQQLQLCLLGCCVRANPRPRASA